MSRNQGSTAPSCEVDALLATADLLDREPSIDRAFAAFVAVVRPVVAFDVIALTEDGEEAPLVACASDREELRSQAVAVLASARRYFEGAGTFEEYMARVDGRSSRWVTLPLSVDGSTVSGLMTFASEGPLREETVTFLAAVARQFARTSMIVRSDLVTDRTKLVAGDTSLGRADVLGRLTLAAASLLSGACAIDFEEDGRLRRMLHAPRLTAATISRLDRIVARVMADGMAVQTDATVDPENRGWLVAVPIMIGGHAIGVFSAFGDGAAPALYGPLVQRFAEGAERAIVRGAVP